VHPYTQWVCHIGSPAFEMPSSLWIHALAHEN
jgi:hypothetical protein